jgi:ATP-binding cassette, subfamily F, member 3
VKWTFDSIKSSAPGENTMILLQANHLKKAFGADVLFEDVCFYAVDHDKIGLIGANGAGKTTLMKILTREIEHDGGSIHVSQTTKLGYMQQHSCPVSDRSVYDEALTGFAHLMQYELDMVRISRDIENKDGELETLVHRQHELIERFEQEGGLTYRSRTRSMLLGLGFSESDLDLPVRALSGGQKTRITLGKLLLSQANLLLLDEPTNHLDIGAVEWLENFLQDYRGAFIIISHDRYFLDKVTRRTFEMANGGLSVYEGNYSWSMQKKAEDIKAMERQYANTRKEIVRIEGIIAQQRQWNKERSIRTAESKQKMADRLARTLVKPPGPDESIRISFQTNARGGNDVLLMKDISKSFEHKTLFQNVNLHIRRGERVFLLGPNGCGKTTLFRIALGQLQPDTGISRIGASMETGYYDQSQSDLDEEKTAIETLQDAFPDMTQTQIRNALAALLFRNEDVFKKISMLSGGERARICLLKLMLGKANFLLLDEPTNHLDISAREELEKTLLGYDGTFLIISHDRYLINKLADRIILLTQDGLKNYQGNYDEFHALTNAGDNSSTSKRAPSLNSYQTKKESEAAERRRLGQIGRCEHDITGVEEEIRILNEELSLPGIANDYMKLMELTDRTEEKRSALEALYAEWESLHQTNPGPGD